MDHHTHTNIWWRRVPRNWAMQVKKTDRDKNWVTIARQEDNPTFAEVESREEAEFGQVARFAIGTPTREPVQLVRMVQTGESGAGNSSFCLNQIELFGELMLLEPEFP
jgi:hypothetical protein